MKPPPFRYVRADSVARACDLLAEHGAAAQILAGGQSLMALLNMRLAAPALLIDINGLEDLAGIAVEGGVLRIGALARHCAVLESEPVRRHAPLIAAALPHVAHPAVRNRGTFGGSLALADPAAELPACCLAYGATILLGSRRGERRVAAEDFFRGIYETAREPDELLLAAEIPVLAEHRWSFRELSRRRGDYAIAGLAALARPEGAALADARFAFFGVADRPVLARAAARQAAAGAGADAAADALAQDLDPRSDFHARRDTRLHLAGVLLRRALADLATPNGTTAWTSA